MDNVDAVWLPEQVETQ